MNLTEESKHKLQIQDELLFRCRTILDDLNFIVNSDKGKKVLDNDVFMARVYENWWRMLIIELSMIYDIEGNYSIHKCLNLFINRHKSVNWANEISVDELKGFQSSLDKEEIITKVKSLKNIRDGNVAHRDQSFNQPFKLLLQDLNHLYEYAQNINSKLSFALNGHSISHEHNLSGKMEVTINELLKLNEENDKDVC